MRRRSSLLLACGLTSTALAAASVIPAAAQDPDRVFVVHLVVDSLHPSEVGPNTPTLNALKGSGTWYEEARSVMASETLPNHVAMGTGTYPGTNGIPGNDGRVTAGDTEGADPDLGQPALLGADSFVTAIERVCPDLRTVTALSKGYVYRIFSEDGADADYTTRQTEIPASGHVPDTLITGFLQQQLSAGVADYVFVNLGDVDRAGHVDPTGASGFFAGGRQAAIQQVDALIATIQGALQNNGMWDQTVLVINSDHSMDYRGASGVAGVDVAGALETVAPGRFFVSENGGAGLVYLNDPTASDANEVLALARPAIAALGGVDEALYREPNPLEPGMDLASVHRDWHLDGTDRAGEIFVTLQSGYAIGSGNPLPGNHGHAITRHITMLVSGGWDGLAAASSVAAAGAVDQRDDTAANPGQAEQVDLAPTFGWLLGVPDPGVSAGSTPQWEGRVLNEAFARQPAAACVASAPQPQPEPTPTTTPEPEPTPSPEPEPGGGELPATGGGFAVLGLLALGAAAVGRRHG